MASFFGSSVEINKKGSGGYRSDGYVKRGGGAWKFYIGLRLRRSIGNEDEIRFGGSRNRRNWT